MKLKSLIFALMATTVATTAHAEISYQHIRNATAKIEVAGSTFLVDPYLAPKGNYAGFEGTINSQKRNPLIDMKEPVEKVLEGVDAVIVTHTHADHWDEYAQKVLPKTLPIFVQNAGDAQIIRSQGFKDVRVLGKNTEFNKVKLSKTGGQHGTDQMYAIPQFAELLGEAMGVVMQADGEKTLYIVGDTVWNEEVEFALNRYKPEIIVMNTGYAQVESNPDGIIMGKTDVAKARQVAPKADIITVHMDAVNHAAVTSDDMRKFVKEHKLSKVAVPKEGEVLKY